MIGVRTSSPQQRVNGRKKNHVSGWRAEELIEGVPEEIIGLVAGWPEPTAPDRARAKDYACSTSRVESLP